MTPAAPVASPPAAAGEAAPRREAAPRPEQPRRPERVRPPRRAERQARRERTSADDSLEDLERPAATRRVRRSTTFPCSAPAARSSPGGALAVRMVQIVAPLGHGQRALIAGPAGQRARPHLLRRSARGLAGDEERACTWCSSTSARRRSRSGTGGWRSGSRTPARRRATRWRSRSARSSEAKRRGARARTSVLLLDSLSRLARAYGLTRDATGRERRRGDQALVRGGAGRGRGARVPDADRDGARGVRVVVRRARARRARGQREHGRAAAPGPGRARHVPGDRPGPLAHAGRGRAARRRAPAGAREHARRRALARSRRSLGLPGRARPGRAS